jgi:hypothetical protein
MLKGRYHESSNESRSALTGRIAGFGVSHRDTLSSYYHLATIVRLEGRYDEALQYAQHAIHGREILLGADHPDTLRAKIVKARVMLATAITLKDLDEVETLLVDSSNRLSPTLSDTHPIIMSCRSYRALIMQRRGKYEAAEQMNSATLSSQQSGPWMDPATHPDTLTSKHQLAEIIWLKEGCKAADALSEEVYLARTDILTNGTLAGDDFHPDQLTSLQLRAIVLSGLGEHALALEKINLVLSARISLLGANHPKTYYTQTWKAEILRVQLPSEPAKRSHMLDEIDKMHRQAVDGLTAIFGSQHQYTLQCLTHLALAKAERGKEGWEESATIFGVVYRAYRHSVGELHPRTLKAKGRLADAVGRIGRREEGRDLWRSTVGGFSRVSGVESHLCIKACEGYEAFLAKYSVAGEEKREE